MPIPQFTIDGVLPPFVGPNGPGGQFQHLSPYIVSAVETVSTLGTSRGRIEILERWLAHRSELASRGFNDGFQWLDGSFVEAKEPNDLDVVTFVHRPIATRDQAQFVALIQASQALFDKAQVKNAYSLDAFFVDLDSAPKSIVNQTRYYLGLFSHRRVDFLWKGQLQVSLGNQADDDAARAVLAQFVQAQPGA